MQTHGVVIGDIVADGGIELADRVAIAAIELLPLERTEERLHHWVVSRSAGTRIRDIDLHVAAKTARSHRRVRRTPVGMKDQHVGRSLAFLACGAKRQQDEVHTVAQGNAAGDGLARKEVEDGADVVLVSLELELRHVARPDHVRSRGVEVLPDEVWESGIHLVEDDLGGAANALESERIHQLANLLVGHGSPALPHDGGDFCRAENLLMLIEDPLDFDLEHVVAKNILALLSLGAEDVVVERPAINLKGVADRVNAVLFAQFACLRHEFAPVGEFLGIDGLQDLPHGAFML